MARPLRIEFPGACYHIMNRGNDRLPIFDTDEDSKLFIEKLADFSESYKVSVRSYCLMTNHFHLYLCTPEGNLSKFMQSLMTSFTVTKNRRDRRHRHLFQARFKSLLVDDEGYGSRVSRYIHLNPGMVKSVESLDFSKQVKVVREYSWSSYRAIIGLSKRPKWLDRNSVLCRWGPKVKDQQGNYAKYVEEGLLREIEDPFEVAVARSILGTSRDLYQRRRLGSDLLFDI